MRGITMMRGIAGCAAPPARGIAGAPTRPRRIPMHKAALYTAGAIFAVGTVAHAVRLATGFEIAVAGFVVPVWVSVPGVLVAGLLAVWMVLAARRP
jgi:hypothetical protein